MLATAACGTAPRVDDVPSAAVGRDADRLLVVDCLLPGQLRRLGRNISFMTPRRPLRTSASECEIRGGEYVAYDRANFATSLRTWLPQAESGDAHAQTLVGEIFEKGLGQVADPTVAAEWYRRAVEQGYSRAQINLGYLYESGLGVERDLTRAMNLYRQAAGFEDGSLEYVTSIELATRQQQAAELPRLREQVRQSDERLAAEREEFAALQENFRRLEREAETARRSLMERSTLSEAVAGGANGPADATTRAPGAPEGARAGAASSSPASASGPVPAPAPASADVTALITEIETLKSRLGRADAESATLLERLESQQRESGDLRRRMADARAELSATEEELAAQLDTTERVAVELESARARDDAASRQRVAGLEEELAAARAAETRLRDDMARLDAEHESSTGELAASLELAETREASLLRDLEGVRGQLRSVRSSLAQKDRDYRERLDALGETSGSLRQRVVEQQTTIAALEEQLATLERTRSTAEASAADERSAEAAITTLRAELDEARERLADAQAGRASDDASALAALAELEAELERQRSRVAEKEATIGSLQKAVSDAQADSEGPAIERVSSVVERGPVIEIIDPPVSVGDAGFSIPVAADAAALDVVGRVTPAADLISFQVNGGAASLNQHGVFKHSAPLARSTTLSLAAVDNAGARTALEIALVPEAAAGTAANAAEAGGTRSVAVDVSRVDFGRYHALVIGNSNYASMPDIDSSAVDATALSRVLESRFGFGTELLLDADRYDMLAALNRKRDELTGEDNLLIFFAGHSEVGGGQGYWMPVDADPADKSTWVSNVALTGLVDAMDAKHVLVIADAVFPATLSQSAIPRLGRSMDADERLQLYQLASSAKVRTVLSSGATSPVRAPGASDGRSAFGASVLDALADDPRNVIMTHDVFVGMRDRMESAGLDRATLERPRYAPMRHAGHENGEFLFVPLERQVGALSPPHR